MAADGIRSLGFGGLAAEEDWADLEPFFFDEAVAVAEHAAAEERRRQKEDKEARKKAEYDRRLQAHQDALDRITTTVPRTAAPTSPASTLKISPTPFVPMRYTDTYTETSTNQYGLIYRHSGRNWYAPATSANILSVKIASSDVGFPIKVYGTVIARDSLDYKCVSLFNRDEHHCQLIDSEVRISNSTKMQLSLLFWAVFGWPPLQLLQPLLVVRQNTVPAAAASGQCGQPNRPLNSSKIMDDELILTGPKRGLVLVDAIYVEIDLKIKGDCGQQDRELSKGYIMVDGIRRKPCEKMVVERDSLDSKLSTVEVMFAVVKRSTEATITIDVVQGEFEGKITAHTTSIQNSLVLYDSRVAVSAVVGTSGDETQHTVEFNPAVNGGDEAEIACGSFKMVVKD
nr:unnamed protein product [Digitaria exilis]